MRVAYVVSGSRSQATFSLQDLSRLGRDLARTIIIDNEPRSFILQVWSCLCAPVYLQAAVPMEGPAVDPAWSAGPAAVLALQHSWPIHDQSTPIIICFMGSDMFLITTAPSSMTLPYMLLSHSGALPMTATCL